MEEREIIEMEDTMENAEECEERSGMSTGKAIFVGALLGIAGTAITRFAHRKWTEHKAKKEQSNVIEADFSEHDDDSDDDE